MLGSLALVGAGLVVASLPYWLPPAVVALRVRIFARVNGAGTVTVPSRHVGVEQFRRLYGHPAADGRSRGAALSDLFWYWLSPGPHVHQEHLEPGERYEQVAHATRNLLRMPRAAAEELTTRCAELVLDAPGVREGGLVRLRDLLMPVWADFYYRLVFDEACPPYARRLIVANATDVASALKCCGLRHMDRRDRLTRFLVDKIRAGDVVPNLPDDLTVREQALYLQGVFFNTAVVQSSEAMAHLLMVAAHHPDTQQRLLDDEAYREERWDIPAELGPEAGDDGFPGAPEETALAPSTSGGNIDRAIHFFELPGETVWGATARILVELLEHLTESRQN